MKKIGRAIRQLRKERGYTQEEFAYLAQLARPFYGRIERGEQNIAMKTLFHLSKHLKVRPGELLDDISLAECEGEADDQD